MQKKIPKELLSYLILKLTENNPQYGYGLINEFKELSNQHWDPSYGTVYGAIKRLKKNGYLKRIESEHEDRKYFKLTQKGQKQLKERKKEIENLKEKSQDRILGFLNIYKNIYGEENFNDLLDKIHKEFDITQSKTWRDPHANSWTP